MMIVISERQICASYKFVVATHASEQKTLNGNSENEVLSVDCIS